MKSFLRSYIVVWSCVGRRRACDGDGTPDAGTTSLKRVIGLSPDERRGRRRKMLLCGSKAHPRENPLVRSKPTGANSPYDLSGVDLSNCATGGEAVR